jgi:putative ABC transport system ATP-binding protein
MIRTVNLSKTYTIGEVKTEALRGVSLTVREGEFVAVMGPSGCGKSTLLNVLGLIDIPTGGEYHFLGNEVSHIAERARAALRKANIGFVFQNYNLIEEMTIAENLELPLRYLKIPAAGRKKRMDDVLERLQIAHLAGMFPRYLSGGQQQHAAVARAVACRPRLILADEPTGNLDSQHGDEVMRLLVELNEGGTTIVMVTHSPSYALYCHRCIHLFDGRIVSESIRGSSHG